jgi:hypothetical protein
MELLVKIKEKWAIKLIRADGVNIAFVRVE